MSDETQSGEEQAPASPQLAEDFLAILVCPEDKTPVHQAEQEIVDKINTTIETGKLLNRGGSKVAEAIDGGLIREDGKYLYPIRDGIPIMLIDEAIALEEE